jgi:hypothetical protein
VNFFGNFNILLQYSLFLKTKIFWANFTKCLVLPRIGN